jgi:anti-sigma factor RsiW
MIDNASHLGLTLQDFLDGRLDAGQQAQVRVHLAGCSSCRRELEALRWVRDVALKQLPSEEVPPALAARVAAALDAAPRTVARPWRRWTGAGALLGAAAVALLLLLAPPRDLVNAVARDYAAYAAGSLELGVRSFDGAVVESAFVRGGITFRARVFDLGMMQYRLVGGRVHRVRGRPSALFAYRGPAGQDLVCQMYEGQLTDLAQSDDVRERNGITFRVYRVRGLTLVFWQEGAAVCVLASDGDPEAVIQLAYAKAVKV